MPLPQAASTLAPDLAFVVQLQTQPSQTTAELAGRVEHIASGEASSFASLAELRAFMGKAAGTGG